MYFAYGWPKALSTGASALDSEAIYLCQGSGEYVIAVFTASVQVWSGGQHRLKLGELRRSQEQLEEEGANVRAHWCPQKRVLAVATANNYLHLYALNVSSEALWRLPSSQEVKRVNVYLSHSIQLDYGLVRVADLSGDAKSLLVALTNGTMQVFSWQGKLRGQSNPFATAYEGRAGSRQQRHLRSASGNQPDRRSSLAASSSSEFFAVVGSAAAAGGSSSNINGLLSPPVGTSRSSSVSAEPGNAALLAAMASMDLPQPTPMQPADAWVARVHYNPAARMVALVLQDGRCALCRTADSGIHPIEQLQLFRWVYKPAGPTAPVVVAAALNPTAQLLALGLSHGRVAIYTLQSLMSVRHSRSSSVRMNSGGLGEAAAGVGGGGGGGLGQPEPARVLSLADWGYRSSVVGAAASLQWSPDGRVLAVGYADRGMAVWTPSGCRLMCSLRQAVAAPAGSFPPGAQQAVAPPTPPAAALPTAGSGSLPEDLQAAPSSDGSPAKQQQEPLEKQQQEGQQQANGGLGSQFDSPRKAAPAASSLLHQTSCLNPSHAPEPGVLEGGVSALTWTSRGYHLLLAESGQAGSLRQLEFARHIQGSHRVVQQAEGGGGSGHDEVQAMQAGDRLLLITETRQAVNPALRVPSASSSQQSEAEVARPDLVVQHVKLPQQYIEAAYPLMHAAISQEGADVAVAGTRGLAVYSCRTRRWRLFGDATQERNLRVQGLMWLPGGIIAACAYVDGKEGGGAPQLLLYPQAHLDNTSLLARLPLKQVPVAMDTAGWHMVLAFAPLEIKLFRVTVEGPVVPAGKPIARLSAVRELSIMGLGNPLQEIALIDPYSMPQHPDLAAGAGALEQQQAQQQEEQQGQGSSGASSSRGGSSSWPKLTVATKPRLTPPGTPIAAEAGAAAGSRAAAAGGAPAAGMGMGGSEAPQQCVLLRAGGIMSKLDMQEGSEVLLSDAIERFWLPISSAATVGAGSRSSSLPGHAARSDFLSSSTPTGGNADGTPSFSASSSVAALNRHNSSEADLPSAPAAAAVRLREEQQQGVGGDEQQHAKRPPRVEMPWWTYGARGMQLWFPSSLSEPLTPSLRSLTSPTATGLAAAAAAASTNSTDPELEFDREVYPIGVSLAEVSIIGVTQRTVRSTIFPPEAAQSLCFHPLPESQPVLPCLLRRLLQKERHEDALELARWHSGGPHFNRSLEWLLFTALELDSEQQHTSSSSAAAAAPPAAAAAAAAGQAAADTPHDGGRAVRQKINSPYSVTVGEPSAAAAWAAAAAGGGAPQEGLLSPRGVNALTARARSQRRAGPLLVAAARLISQFPQFPEIVVSVARKTDAALWPSLFAAVGSPGRLCQGLMNTDKLQSAACCLVIVEQIEGTSQAQAMALQLIQAALDVGQYSLATDLLRFLVPPGDADVLLEPMAGVAAAVANPLFEQQQQRGEEGGAEQLAQELGRVAVQEAAPDTHQRPQQQQQEQQQEPRTSSWFWGMFGGGGGNDTDESPVLSPRGGTPDSSTQQQQQQQSQPIAVGASSVAAAVAPAPAVQQAQQQQAQQQQEEEEGEEAEEDGASAGEAWRLTARHAWKLLDAGALRESARMARSLAELHGGLPALLLATAGEVPESQAHLTPSAAAIASALFVAANEFAAADQEVESAQSAEILLSVCQASGCVNLATALALLLGDHEALQQFAEQHPAVWAALHRLIANDVHLCGYAPMLSPVAQQPLLGMQLAQQQQQGSPQLTAAA